MAARARARAARRGWKKSCVEEKRQLSIPDQESCPGRRLRRRAWSAVDDAASGAAAAAAGPAAGAPRLRAFRRPGARAIGQGSKAVDDPALARNSERWHPGLQKKGWPGRASRR